jgi:hypothetical protein
MKTTITIFSLSALFACLSLSAQERLPATVPKTPSKAYDPLALPSEQPPAPLDLTVTDTNRHRDIPILVYLPADTNTAPVVLFSHGLGGNRQGSAYELVLHDAEHSAFTDRALPGDSGPRNPNHHRAILALSTAFWDAYLKADPAARAWLDGVGPRTVLESNDRWQTK